MPQAVRRRTPVLLSTVIAALFLAPGAAAQTARQQSASATLPSETPAHFNVATATWDYQRVT